MHQQVLKNNVLKARGFLLRKSFKYTGKWSFCFFYIDINLFVRGGIKILKSFRPTKKVIDREFMQLFEMKRMKLNEQTQLLIIPNPQQTYNQ